MGLSHIADTLYRWAYLVAMYSGIRAVHNRISSQMSARDCALSRFNRTHLQTEHMGEVVLFVHKRSGPGMDIEGTAFGMISVQQRNPKVGRFLYRYFCLTSHFGCGHMEIAFYEKQGKVTLYAVRNTAASNAFRLKWFELSDKLTLAQWDERVLRIIVRHLESNGFTTGFADVSESINLSVNNRLLHPHSRLRALRHLKKKYTRLRKTFVASTG